MLPQDDNIMEVRVTSIHSKSVQVECTQPSKNQHNMLTENPGTDD